MMLGRRATALLVVGLLLALLVASVGPVRAEPVGGSGPSTDVLRAPLAATVTVATLDAAGDPATDFSAGTAYGPDQVYFFVSDFDVTDRSANLSVTDPYAARDGLTNPVWTGTVGFTATQRNNTTTTSGLHFTIPSTLLEGGVWTVTASATAGGSAVANFTVETFYLTTSSNPLPDRAVVPGESITLYWTADATSNGATYTELAELTLNVSYTANGTVHSLYPGGRALSPSGLGSLPVAIPGYATTGTAFTWTFVGSVLNGTVATENESATGTLFVTPVTIYAAALAPTPFCTFVTLDTYFDNGSTATACLEAGASYEGSFTPVSGLSVSLSFSNATGAVSPPGGPPSHLVTNSSGEAAATYQATVPPFTSEAGHPGSTETANYVRFEVTDPSDLNRTGGTAWENLSFWVGPPPEAGLVSVTLNEVVYFTGDTVSAQWSVTSTNESGTGVFSPFAWVLYALPSATILADGNLSSAATSGTLTVPLSTSYTGEFSVEIEAANATTVATGEATAWVRAPEILVTPSAPYYLPGDSLTFTVATVGGQILAGSTIYFDVWAFYVSSTGVTLADIEVANGTVANGGDVLVAVPVNATPSEYEVTVWAQSPTLGLYASSDTTVSEAAGFQVVVGVLTRPVNSDGTFAPGQPILVSYAIEAYGDLPLPRSYTIEIGIWGTLAAASLQTASASGNASLTLPKNLPQGTVEIFANVYGTGLSGPNCNADECSGFTWIPVNPHPPVTPAAAPGLGFTEAWYLLLGIVVAVAIGLYLVLRRRAPPRRLEPPSEDELEPPAPAPSEPAPEEWNEPEPAQEPEARPPPLPEPPGGDR